MTELKLILNFIDKSAILLQDKKIIEIRNFDNNNEATLMVYKNIKIDILVVYSLFDTGHPTSNLLPLFKYNLNWLDDWQCISKRTFDVIQHLAKVYNVKTIQFFTAIDYYRNYLNNSGLLWIIEPYKQNMCSIVQMDKKEIIKLTIVNHSELIDKIKEEQKKTENLKIITSKVRNPESIANIQDIMETKREYLGFLDLIENNVPIHIHKDINAPFINKYTPENQEKLITKEIYTNIVEESLKNIPIEKRIVYFKKGINIPRIVLTVSLAILTVSIVTLLFIWQNKSTILADMASRENNIKMTESYLEQLDSIIKISKTSSNISAKKILNSVYLYFEKENIKAIKINNTTNTVYAHLKYDSEEELYEAINKIGDEFRLQPTEEESVLPSNEIQLILDYVNQN